MANLPRIVLTGGVSGGHTFPLIAVARALRQQYAGAVEFLFIGSRGAFEGEAMTAEGIPAQYVLTGKMRRYFSWHNFVDPFKVPIGFLQALWKLFVFMPDVIFAKGGSASVPVVLAAWLYRIPIVIHDSDAVAGRANRFLARFATRIAVAYPSARHYFPVEKTSLIGNPVRQEILAGDVNRAAATFQLDPAKPTLLVLGGSQGAIMLNEAVLHILPDLLRAGIQIIHQTGKENYQKLTEVVAHGGIDAQKSGYCIRDFLSVTGVADALAMATVVLSRAGAGSIAELAATKKAAILVPLSSAANDEQRMNAHDVAAAGGAIILEESNLGQHLVLEKVLLLLKDANMRAQMGEHLHAFYQPNAAEILASGLRELADS